MRPWVNNIVKVLIVTIVTVGLSRMITYIPLNVSFFASSNVADINQFDIYSELLQSQGILPYESDVIVVTLPHGSTRYELAEALMMLSECDPAAISVDINLADEKDPEIDEMLTEAIRANHNVVFPCMTDCLADTARFFADRSALGVGKGYTNLDNRNRDNAVIRSFTPYFIDGTDTIYSLSLEAVRQIHPEKIAKLNKRGKKHEYINFLVDISTISYEEIPEWGDAIKGSIVILGVDTQADVHRTSIDPQIIGLKIHAYIASTVLRSDYINTLPQSATELIVFAVIVLFVYCNLFFSRKFPRTSGFFVRTVTYMLFFSLMILSYVVFAEKSIYLDCGWFLLAIAFTPWALDIYNFTIIAFEEVTKLYRHTRKALSGYDLSTIKEKIISLKKSIRQK